MYPRKANRHRLHDYSTPGYYYLTICIDDNEFKLSRIDNSKSILNDFGKIIQMNLMTIPKVYSSIKLDEYIIMPDHIHCILIITDNNYKTYDRTKMLLSNAIQQFKKISTMQIKEFGYRGKLWQRSFYDRIIRNERELYNVRKYIQENPLRYEIKNGYTDNLEL